MNKRLRSCVSWLIVMCMFIGLCSTGLAIWAEEAAVEDEDVFRYASLGASNTNGYGVRGYLPIEVTMDPLIADKSTLNVYGYDRAPVTAYPFQVATALAQAAGKKMEISQLAISSMRAEEVRMLLDDTYYGDAYTAWRFYNADGNGWFAQAESQGANSGAEALANLRAAYRDALTNADVISVDLGMNNFGVYTFNNIKSVLGNGTFWKAPDFSLILNEENINGYLALKQMLVEALASEGNIDAEMQKRLDMACDVLCYAVIGFCHNFDIIMEKIYEMNPDAQVVVVGVQNLLHGVMAPSDMGALPLDKAYGLAIELANTYTQSMSPYADRYAHATVGESGHAHTFLDEILEWNGDPTTLTDNMKDCFDMYDDNLYVRSIIEYVMVAPALGIQMPASLQSMIASGNISLDKLDLSDPELLTYIGQAAQKLATFRLGQNLAENEKPVYQAYVNTLNTVYGIIATIVQEAAKINILDFGAGGFDGFGAKSDQLMGYIFGEVIKGAQTSFMGSLQNPNFTYEFKMDETLLQDPGIAMVAMLAVRFDLGNSFYAHPSDKGHDELTEAILEALGEDPRDTAYLHRYQATDDSHYLALGDADIYGPAADNLAQRLNAAVESGVGYTNLTAADQTAAELLAQLPAYADQIKKSDLITLAFDSNHANHFMVSQLKAMLSNKQPAALDWEGVLGAEYAETVKNAVEGMKQEIMDSAGSGKVMGLDIAQVIAVVIESYTYCYAEHLISYYKLCSEIHAINPKVQILTVGAYNPFAGVVLNMEGNQLDVGGYVEYLRKLTGIVYVSAAATTETCTYVPVPEAKSAAQPAVYEVVPFIMELLLKGAAKYDMSTESYAHVEERLWSALDVSMKTEEPEPPFEPELPNEPEGPSEPEEPEVTLGDVDGNRTVNHIDAMLVLQYYTEVAGTGQLDLSVADMNADGAVDHIDAMLILQHYTQG